MRSITNVQRGLFREVLHLPEGFAHHEEVLSPEEECSLIERFEHFPFREFEFRSFIGKRRTVSFGWRYDFNVRRLQETDRIPNFLLAIRQRAARFAGLNEDRLQHALVTEYAPGAAIGCHKDRPVFDDVIGISLRAACLFRSVVRKTRDGSVHQSSSAAGTPVDRLRYSIIFRSLRESKNAPSHRQR